MPRAPDVVESGNADGGDSQDAGVKALLQRMRSEFIEMPGMRLTRDQAARLCGLDRRTSERLLERLVDAGFLFRNESGWYRRTTTV